MAEEAKANDWKICMSCPSKAIEEREKWTMFQKPMLYSLFGEFVVF